VDPTLDVMLMIAALLQLMPLMLLDLAAFCSNGTKA
jgi:hypothetical protein